MAAILRLLIFYGIDFLMAMSEIESFLTFRGHQLVGVFELVPAPIRHGV